MKKTRALTMILAASMLLSLFPVMTSAASEYNYIKIEEEVIVENGNFDKKPEVKNYSQKAYKDIPEGAWGLIPKGDLAKAKYVTEGDNSFLRIEAENNIPTVAYRIGAVEAGSYTLTFDIRRNTTPTDAMNRIYLRVFNLDESFKEASNAAAMVLSGVTVNPTVPQGDDWTTLYFAIELTEAADLAFDFFPKAGGNDAYITGTLDIDNVSLGRPTDILIESADLNAVDATKAYTGADDTTLTAGKWVATDNTYLELDNSNQDKLVAVKKDEDIPNISQVWYNFPEALNAGKYRLTFDVITAETTAGNYGVADVTKGWGERYTLTDASAAQITGGRRYSMTFEVPSTGTNVGFRYFQTDDKTRPSKPFSIENVKLESYTAESFDPNAVSWEVVKEDAFDTSPLLKVWTNNWSTVRANSEWATRADNGGTATITHDSTNKRLVFGNDGNHSYIAHQQIGPFEPGDYRVVFDVEYARNTSKTEDYTVKTWTQMYIASPNDLGGFVGSPEDGHLTGTVGRVIVPFTLASEVAQIYFRTKVDKSTSSPLPPTYYVDNYKLERKVVGAVIAGSWSTIYDSTTASAPTIKTDAGVSDGGRKNYKDAWLIRENGNAIAATKLEYAGGKLEVTANETAIFGKPTVMYRFSNTLAKGTYSVDAYIKSLANVGFGETYTLSAHFSNGQEPVTLAQPVGNNTEVHVSLRFDIESDSSVVLCVQSTTGNTFTSAFEIREVNLNKLSNPLVQLRSNADLATFDSDEGVYYMAVNAQRDIYLNYFANTDLRSGQYMLSAEFKTAADQNVQLFANFGIMDLDVNTI